MLPQLVIAGVVYCRIRIFVISGSTQGWDSVALEITNLTEIPRVEYGRVRYYRRKYKGNYLITIIR